jgi:DNA polymerase-3 subunit alpha
LGSYFSGHPLDSFRKAWQKCAAIDLRHPEKATKDKPYNFIGMLREVRLITTKKGTHMARAVLEDYNGSMPLIVFPKEYEKSRHYLEDNAIVGISGNIEFDEGREIYQILAKEFKNPEEMEAKAASELHIQIGEEPRSEEEFSRLRAVFVDNPGRCTIYLHMNGGGRMPKKIKVSSQIKSAYTKAVVDRIRDIPWVLEVWEQ